MAEPSFGKHIKELRTQQRLTQRELAAQVAIDVGYISKIEAEKVPPPSEKVIERLALVLEADKDELMVLAGRAPKDLERIITRDVRIPTILRRARELSPQDWEKVESYIEQLKASKRER
jgi:transcriptional regulator with XRE-family HTH domain